jgi:hypothetical protein
VALEPVGEIGQHIPSQELRAKEVTGGSKEVGEKPASQPSEDPVLSGETVDEEVENKVEIPDLVDQEDEDSDDEAEEEADDEDHEDNGASLMQLRRSDRIRDGVKKPSRYAMVTKKVQSNSIGDEEMKQSLNKAEEDEIRLVFEELDAMEPVRKEDIPQGYKAHNTHLFTVEKFMADGKHDKFKSRLVAHGNEQDATIYADRSSPTVAMQSLMTCMTLAACNRDCAVAKLDVKGAFIQTDMSGVPVYVQCRGRLKDTILKILPQLEKYVSTDGVLYCRLKKALYGCVQASKLWYEKLRNFLVRIGYEQSETDQCVFRKVIGDRVYLITVYVDDLLIFATEDELERLRVVFTTEFKWITMEVGRVHSYLGMQLFFRDGQVEVDMTYYLAKVLQEFADLKEEALPGK